MAELDRFTLRNAAQGDASAQTQLVECYQQRVFALLGRMLVHEPHAAADLAQETFLKVLKHLDRFDPAGAAKLSSWILTIATRTGLDHLKKRKPELGWVGDSSTLEIDPERASAVRQQSSKVERAMAQLTTEQRSIIVLRAFHDLDYDEIADILEIETGTVKSRLSRARRALKSILEAA